MKKLSREIRIGLFLSALYNILHIFTDMHEFFLGLIFGLVLCFYLLNFLPESFKDKLSIYKTNLKEN